MKVHKIFLPIALVLICLITVLAADATGKWTATISTQIGEQAYTYTFKVEGEKLTGKASSQFGDLDITDGKVKGDDISFVENAKYQDMAIRIEYKGKISGDEIKFMRQVGEFATEEFIAKRAK